MQIYFHSRLWSYLPRVPILVEGTVYNMWFDQCGAVVQNCNSALLDAIEEHPPHYSIYIYIYILELHDSG